MPLSEEIVQSATVSPDKSQLKLSDGGGLYLLVKKAGRYWKLAYRFEGKQKSLALGVYPRVTLEQARIKRDEAKLLLKQGIDPSEVKKQQKREQQYIPQPQLKLQPASAQESAKPNKAVPERAEVRPQNTAPLLQHHKQGDIEWRRLSILQIVSGADARRISETALQTALDDLGFRVSFDRLRTDMAWLYEQEVITLQTGDVWQVQLSQSGLDVIHSRLWVPGIRQPASDE